MIELALTLSQLYCAALLSTHNSNFIANYIAFSLFYISIIIYDVKNILWKLPVSVNVYSTVWFFTRDFYVIYFSHLPTFQAIVVFFCDNENVNERKLSTGFYSEKVIAVTFTVAGMITIPCLLAVLWSTFLLKLLFSPTYTCLVRNSSFSLRSPGRVRYVLQSPVNN